MLKDPLVEAVFEDLDPEDKTEFPEVGEAIKARKPKPGRENTGENASAWQKNSRGAAGQKKNDAVAS